MGEEGRFSREELDALFKRLDALIEEARALQRQINERLLASRRRDQQNRAGQPERRRRPRRR